MKKVGFYVLAVLAVLLLITYAGDYAILRVRIARETGYGSVTVSQYYAVNEKNNRTEYVFGSTLDQACVRSLFPHQKLTPCWYLRHHPEQQVRI